MTDRLKAWCHWKRLEKDVSEDDLLMVRDIEALLEVVEALESVLSEEGVRERFLSYVQGARCLEALEKLENVK